MGFYLYEKMRLFGYDINISKNFPDEILSKSNTDFFVSNSFENLGNFRISKKDCFHIMKKNVIINAGRRLVANRVGANGIGLVDKDGDLVDPYKNKEAMEILERANYFFSCPTLYNYIYRSFGMILGAGQKFSTVDKMNGLGKAKNDSKIKILDSRYMTIQHNNYGEVISYNYKGIEMFSPKTVVDYIVYEDLDNPVYGQSQIESIVIDALSDYAIGNRQLIFFKNSARPDVVYMLDREKITNEQQARDFERILKERHQGNQNSNLPIASTFIKDVKILEMSHKDLDLINQRLFSHKESGVALGFDLRLLSYMKDTGGSYSEMDSLTLKNANSQIQVYSKRIEDGMKLEYEKFIGKIPFSFKLKNELYRDEKQLTEMLSMQIESGMITPNIANNILGLPLGSEELDRYYMKSNILPLNDNKGTLNQ